MSVSAAQIGPDTAENESSKASSNEKSIRSLIWQCQAAPAAAAPLRHEPPAQPEAAVVVPVVLAVPASVHFNSKLERIFYN